MKNTIIELKVKVRGRHESLLIDFHGHDMGPPGDKHECTLHLVVEGVDGYKYFDVPVSPEVFESVAVGMVFKLTLGCM